jgi:hypothetical protein
MPTTTPITITISAIWIMVHYLHWAFLINCFSWHPWSLVFESPHPAYPSSPVSCLFFNSSGASSRPGNMQTLLQICLSLMRIRYFQTFEIYNKTSLQQRLTF